MPPTFRLGRQDFLRIQTPRRLNGALFSLVVGTVQGRTHSGGACVISSKTIHRAVQRNTVRRRTRAALLEILPHVRTSTVLVVHAKKPIVSATKEAIRREIIRLAQQTHILDTDD